MKLSTDVKVKDDFGEVISLKFTQGRALDEFCSRNIENYDPKRFEVLAMRLYYGKEMMITVYAIDHDYLDEDVIFKVPVKKFKVSSVSLNDILTFTENEELSLVNDINH